MYNNPYYNSMPRYQSNINQMTQPQYIPTMQQQLQPMQPINNQIGILGKIVDSIEVVKAMDIPLDGSVSYFPLTDGTAIVSKQLQNDGTSKMVVYKPVKEDNDDSKKFVTFEEMQSELAKIDILDLEDLKDEVKEIKKQLKNMKKPKEN